MTVADSTARPTEPTGAKPILDGERGTVELLT